MNVSIRPFHDDDVDQIIALWDEAFPGGPAHNSPRADIERKRLKDPHLLLVAVVGEQVVGTTMAGFDGHRGSVFRVAVAKSHQRQGIATQLMHAVEEALRVEGCHKLNLVVRDTNLAVVEFYKTLGYTIEPRANLGKLINT